MWYVYYLVIITFSYSLLYSFIRLNVASKQHASNSGKKHSRSHAGNRNEIDEKLMTNLDTELPWKENPLFLTFLYVWIWCIIELNNNEKYVVLVKPLKWNFSGWIVSTRLLLLDRFYLIVPLSFSVLCATFAKTECYFMLLLNESRSFTTDLIVLLLGFIFFIRPCLSIWIDF